MTVISENPLVFLLGPVDPATLSALRAAAGLSEGGRSSGTLDKPHGDRPPLSRARGAGA